MRKQNNSYLSVLDKQINFTSSKKGKRNVSLILGLFLSMIIIFLEPFDTNEYEADFRFLSLLGFGVLVALVSYIQSRLENSWYFKVDRVWTVSHEIKSTVLFFLVSGTVIFFYNHFIINGLSYSLAAHISYYIYIVSAMVPIITPAIVLLRQKYGERILPKLPDCIQITGKNKNEHLELQKQNLLCIQSVENYIEIFYLGEDKTTQSKTFRQTLSLVHEQLPFLEKCHRSYLLNLDGVSSVEGNSQSARICFKQSDLKIPLSKTFYKSIKSQFL